MKHLRIATVIGAVLAIAIAGSASAHTGSIAKSQDCETGTTVTAHLDQNVAASATWTITGSVSDSGTGPGPADLGPYDAGFTSGSATLTITFGEESHAYPVEWGAVEDCNPDPTATPTLTPPCEGVDWDEQDPPCDPEPTPTVPPTHRPTATPSADVGGVVVTLPPTDALDVGTPVIADPTADYALVLLGLAFLAAAVLVTPRRKRSEVPHE